MEDLTNGEYDAIFMLFRMYEMQAIVTDDPEHLTACKSVCCVASLCKNG